MGNTINLFTNFIIKIMDVKELRIGNIVNSVFTNEPETIDLWALNKIANGNSQNSYYPHLKVFEPIPLTEEWLIKFGFKIKKSKEDIDYIKTWQDEYDCTFSVTRKAGYNVIYIEAKNNYNEDFYIIQLKSVHQLQNLYFALTNTELTLK